MKPERALTRTRVWVGDVDLAGRGLRRGVGRRWLPERAAVLHHAASAVGLVVVVRALLDLQLLFQSALGFADPLGARLRNRLGFLGALLLEPTLGLAQPGAPAFAAAQLGRQLVAARVAIALVLFGVDGARLFEDLLGELLVATGGVAARVSVQLGRVDSEHAGLCDPGPGAERQDLAEEAGERGFVALAEARDRCVIGRLV
jgi:hypothetical protein